MGSGRAPSEGDLLDWMKLKPRTFGWDAWLAYGRTALNESLLRDYLEREDHHPFAGSISGKVVISENSVWEHLYSVRLGAPQVSFEESNISSARIVTTARALCGAQISVEIVGGSPKHITRVAEYSPLLAPRLVMETFIEKPAGPGEDARYVQMDAATGEQYRFSFPGPLQQQLKGGTFFHEKFAELPQESRYCRMSTLGKWSDGSLSPGVVSPRPFPVLDADGKATSEGGVVLMIAAIGSEPGAHPDPEGDWMYPIPNGYDAALWVSSRYVMHQIVGSGVRGVSADAEFSFDSNEDPSTLVLTKGSFKLEVGDLVAPPLGALSYEFHVPLSGNVPLAAPMEISRSGAGLKLNWKTSTFAEVDPPLLKSHVPEGTSAVDSAWRISSTHAFSKNAGGSLVVQSSLNAAGWFKPVYRQAGVLDPLHYEHFPSIADAISSGLAHELGSFVSHVGLAMEEGGLRDVDKVRWEGVECPGSGGLAVETVHLPRDLALFGHLSERPGAFLVSPTHGRVTAGGKIQLGVTPGHQGLEWSVKAIDGSQGSVGSVSSSGLYTAPSADAMESKSLLVKVNASSGSHSSSVMVEVLSEHVALNPLVFAVASPGAQVRMSAGSQEGGRLAWSLTTATGATLEMAAADDGALFDPGDHVYKRGDGLSGGFFSVDEVAVRSPSGHARSTFVLVVEKQRRGAIRIRSESSKAGEQIQLEFDGGGAQPIPDAVWKVEIGGGSISSSGLYTPDPKSPLHFAVITAEYEFEYGHFGNYLILPTPLIELDEVVKVLS